MNFLFYIKFIFIEVSFPKYILCIIFSNFIYYLSLLFVEITSERCSIKKQKLTFFNIFYLFGRQKERSIFHPLINSQMPTKAEVVPHWSKQPGTLFQVPIMGSRDSHATVIICCLPGYVLARHWNQKQSQDANMK